MTWSRVSARVSPPPTGWRRGTTNPTVSPRLKCPRSCFSIQGDSIPKSTLSLIATLAFCLFSAFAIAQAQDAVPHPLQFQIPPTSVQRPMSAEAVRRAVTGTATPSGASGTSLLPVFNYEVASSRGGNVYNCVIVGAHPATRGSAAQVSVRIHLTVRSSRGFHLLRS